MPSRIPNWNMRAKALVDGNPTTSPCRIPSRGLVCIKANQTQDRVSRHEAVSVKRDREFVVAAPSVAEIANVAGLVAGVYRTSTVGHRNTAFPPRGELADTRFFLDSNRGIACVAQHVEVKAVAGTGRVEPGKHWLQVADNPFGRFIPNAHNNGGRRGNRLVATNQCGLGHDRCNRIGREAHDQKSDDGIP